jgi:hypothetical protein
MNTTTTKIAGEAMTDEQEIELRALVLEYGLAAVIEGDQDRPRQLKRVVDYVHAMLAASTAPAQSCGDAEQADEGEDDDILPTPESERAAFNAMMRWHLIQLLQAWRYGGDLRAAGMAAFEWARTNDVGKAAFEASERAVKIAALPCVAEKADEAVTADVFDWLETEVTAISCRYHGDPSYDHDAYWMRDRVVKLIGEARNTFAARTKDSK